MSTKWSRRSPPAGCWNPDERGVSHSARRNGGADPGIGVPQELIANMLGVRRESVPEAAGKLQRAGLILYSRGRITVVDRPGVEARCCECYQVVKTESDRLLLYVAR